MAKRISDKRIVERDGKRFVRIPLTKPYLIEKQIYPKGAVLLVEEEGLDTIATDTVVSDPSYDELYDVAQMRRARRLRRMGVEDEVFTEEDDFLDEEDEVDDLQAMRRARRLRRLRRMEDETLDESEDEELKEEEDEDKVEEAKKMRRIARMRRMRKMRRAEKDDDKEDEDKEDK